MILIVSVLLTCVIQKTLQQTDPISIKSDLVQTIGPVVNWNQNLGQCTCDMTQGRCDENCCCDPDCSNQVLKKCDNTSSDSSTTFCSKYVVRSNWKSASISNVATEPSGGLCIVFVNSAISGQFYSDSGVYTEDARFTQVFQGGMSSMSLTSYSVDQTYLTKTGYEPGDFLVVNYPSTGLQGFFSLPSPGIGGDCTQKSSLEFGKNAGWSCQRTIANPAISCAPGTSFDLNSYVTSLELVQNPTSGNAASNSVTLGKVTCMSNITGIEGVCTAIPSSPQLIGQYCNNMVSKVIYTFTYAVSGTAVSTVSLKIDIVLTTRSMSAMDRVKQTFETRFNSDTSPDTVIKRSGNPGYAPFMPIVSGTKSPSGGILYIPNDLFGISLVADTNAAGQIGCPGSLSSPVADYVNRKLARFGQNLVSGCTVRLNQSELANSCGQLRTYIYNLQTLTAARMTHVAGFGNASVQNEYEWIPIINSPPSNINDATITSDSAGRCSFLLTNFDIQIMYATYGSTSRPQSRIVGLRYNYVMGSFQWRCLDGTQCTSMSSLNSKQNFRIRSSVSFVPVANAEVNSYAPPIPKSVPYIPDDIWYPFYL